MTPLDLVCTGRGSHRRRLLDSLVAAAAGDTVFVLSTSSTGSRKWGEPPAPGTTHRVGTSGLVAVARGVVSVTCPECGPWPDRRVDWWLIVLDGTRRAGLAELDISRLG